MKRNLFVACFCVFASASFSGCWVAAAGAGAEAGYVASQEKRSAGQTIDDQLIVASVKTKLLADPLVSGLNINVDSFNGVVRLKGEVASAMERNRALEIARSVGGVTGVNAELITNKRS